ncbi:MAG: DUF3857 and transglutaminase domain-containing protein [Acidobacteriota bacterium]|nr:DUF3857 and transglutaminase domain-containing protein [Acidobacteriota bacterium]
MFFLRKSVFVVLFFALFAITILAVDEPVWRPINPAELTAKEPTVEKDADAEAIFWEVRLDDKKASSLAYEHYVRVKIFTERGRERFSKFDIPFLKGKKVKDVAARVVKPDGSIIELKPTDIFEREIVKGDGIKIKAVSFAMPGIEPGVILEYRYKEIFKNDSASGERLVFQRDIPIRRMSYYIRPYEGQLLQTESFNMPLGVGFSKDKDGFSVATMTNVPAFKEEPRMPPSDQVRSWALIYYSGFFDMQRWQSFAMRFSMVMKDWIKPNGEVKKAAAEITAGAATQEEKLKRIYDFVQKQIKNVSFDSTMTPEQIENIENKKPGDTLKRRMGTSPDIEKLFASLATAAGMEARIVMSGDRSEYFFNPDRNSHMSFVHFACVAVKLGENWQYFNPGTPYLPYGKLLWHEEDAATILIGEDNFLVSRSQLSDVEATAAKRTGRFKLLEDGSLTGTLKIEFTGHNAINRRSSGFNDSEQKRADDFKNELKEQISAADITDVKVENFGDNSLPLVYSAKVSVPGYAQKTGKRLFLQPGFFKYNSQPVFSSATRLHPIFFRYPWSEKDDIEIELPAGFALENADTPGLIADKSQIGKVDVSISVTKDNKLLVYKRSFHFGKGGNVYFPVETYGALKGMFDAFHKADTHSLVLKQETTTAAAGK